MGYPLRLKNRSIWQLIFAPRSGTKSVIPHLILPMLRLATSPGLRIRDSVLSLLLDDPTDKFCSPSGSASAKIRLRRPWPSGQDDRPFPSAGNPPSFGWNLRVSEYQQ